MRRLRIIDDGIHYRHDEDHELREAYECGRKDAYREIMEEKYGHDGYHERHYPTRGGHILYREHGHDMLPDHPMYRHHDFIDPDGEEIVYRRRRDSRGRYM